MNINAYLRGTDETAVYPDKDSGSPLALSYVALGLTGEAGEVAEKIKKVLRDSNGTVSDETRAAIQKELGDVAWYWVRLHRELGLDPSETLMGNLFKLQDRKKRGVLGGSGDAR